MTTRILIKYIFTIYIQPSTLQLSSTSNDLPPNNSLKSNPTFQIHSSKWSINFPSTSIWIKYPNIFSICNQKSQSTYILTYNTWTIFSTNLNKWSDLELLEEEWACSVQIPKAALENRFLNGYDVSYSGSITFNSI